jgi:monoamine oxidase
MIAASRRGFIAGATALAGSAALPRVARAATSRDADVIVIGAGLSGLYAASLLEAEGARVVIAEGRQRVGGRLFTLDDVPGHPEAGGNGIGAGYARIIDLAKRANVGLVPVRQRTETTLADSLINLRGVNIKQSEWAASRLNPFPAGRKEKMPWAYAGDLYLKANPLKEGDSWTDPRFAKWDISLYDFLKQNGESEATIDLVLRTAMLYGSNPYDFSVLALFHTFAWGAQQLAFGREAFAIAGGNQRLPEAVARGLKGDLDTGRVLTGVATDATGATARFSDGSRLRAKAVLVTAPFTALRSVHFDPVLPPLQAEAIDLLGYSTAFQAHFVADKPFWEIDRLPQNMWTDGPAGRFAALHYGDDPSKATTFLAFVNGAQGERLDRMAPEDATREITDFLARVRPSTAGALRPVKTVSWQRDPFAGGIYSAWKPGQITRYGASVAQPHGRIFFAGEHTAMLNRGMEGAAESGERAAGEILGVI